MKKLSKKAIKILEVVVNFLILACALTLCIIADNKQNIVMMNAGITLFGTAFIGLYVYTIVKEKAYKRRVRFILALLCITVVVAAICIWLVLYNEGEQLWQQMKQLREQRELLQYGTTEYWQLDAQIDDLRNLYFDKSSLSSLITIVGIFFIIPINFLLRKPDDDEDDIQTQAAEK